MKVLTIIGARPQFIKAAAVSRVISNRDSIDEILVHTGQHYDANMSDVFFDELGIQSPKYNLGIGGGNHGIQTGKMLEKIESVIIQEKPNWVLVYGDTNSTLAGALGASKLHYPVAHVEAGLRSFNKKMPEEINRVLTDHVSDVLFAPTNEAERNLENEGIVKDKVIRTGDIMLDMALYGAEMSDARVSVINDLGLSIKDYILVTIHRAENTDDPDILRGIFEELEKLSTNHQVVLPLHPRTKRSLDNLNYSVSNSSMNFIEPVGFLDMVALEKHSSLIITDSGGVQKEAYFHRVPCVTLREETEWTELVTEGCNILANSNSLIDSVDHMLNKSCDFDGMLYGNGKSSELIVDALE